MWKDAGDDPVEIPPTYVEDVTSTFASYFDRAGVPAKQVSSAAFELVVAAWLGDLTHNGYATPRANRGWLDESGFRSVLQDGRVELEAVG